MDDSVENPLVLGDSRWFSHVTLGISQNPLDDDPNGREYVVVEAKAATRRSRVGSEGASRLVHSSPMGNRSNGDTAKSG